MNPIHLSNQEIISCYLCTLDGLECHRNDMGTLAIMWLNLEDWYCLSSLRHSMSTGGRLQWSGKSVGKMAAIAFSQALLVLQCLPGQDSHISGQESKPSSRYMSVILCSNCWLHLTFIAPCIANIFSEYNQRDATILNLFISVRRSTFFRKVFPSIVRSLKLHIKRQVPVRPSLLPVASLARLAAGSSNGLKKCLTLYVQKDEGF